MKTVLILGSQHGNELLGIHLYEYITRNSPNLLPYVEYLCGNPRAVKQNTRFIETDLNRSYNTGGTSYEEGRSVEILNFIRENNFTYVLDAHTTTAPTEGFFISSILNDTNREIIRASKIVLIVEIPPTITAHSLIGNIPSSISLEFNENYAKDTSTLQELTEFIERLIMGETVKSFERKVYQITGPIENDEDTIGFTNFELSPRGYYPILYGEKNYTDHQGFKAKLIGNVRI